jgi:hypothetical protein
MTRATWTRRVIAVGVVAAAAGLTAARDDAPKAGAAALTEKEKAAGWRVLFDGTSTDQWRNYNKDALSDKWKVVDGALVRTGSAGDIVTKEQYDSFDLVLEYRISKAGNSGLMFRVMEVKGKPPYDSGPEVQILDNALGKDPQRAGWLYQLYQPPTDPKTGKPLDATKPAGEWNQIRFLLDGAKGTVWMNGTKYYDFEIGSDEWKSRLAKSKFAKWENFAKATKGHICLQDHGDEVAFRNIKIRPLSAK